jgi:hypothetical protein
MTDKQIEKWFVELPEYESYVMAIGHYNKDLGYAGPNNSKVLEYIIPETLYGINLNPAFYQHDANYSIGGNKKDRWEADVTMVATGLFIIENTPDRWYLWGVNTARRHMARNRLVKYFEAVRSQGHKSFNFSGN